MKKYFAFILIIVSVVIYLIYFLSAYYTGWFDNYFLQVTRGQDFFQIPNGAYSFLKGGDFKGNTLSGKNEYLNCCGVNDNVYHPFFTLIVGLPLLLLSPWQAYSFWSLVHLIIGIFVIFLLVRKFRSHKNLTIAISVFLLTNYSYYELINNQYQVILNMAVFMFLYSLSFQNKETTISLYYFIGLITKPIGLLWLVPIFLKRRYRILSGFLLFIICTFIFLLLPNGRYYFDNLYANIFSSEGNWGFFRLIKIIGYQTSVAYLIKYFSLFLIFSLSFFKKINLFLIVILLIIYELFFYDLTFPYHFSILAYILPLIILKENIPINKLFILTLLLIIFPAPIWIIDLIMINNQVNDFFLLKVNIFLIWSYLGLSLLLITIIRHIFSLSKKENCEK